MSIDYTFSVIRYVHDVVAGEFVNVGVVIHAPAVSYARALCSAHLDRVTCLFPDADTRDLRRVMKFIREEVEAYGERRSRPLSAGDEANDVLCSIVPFDDSSLQFARVGGGTSRDLDETLNALFIRYVERPKEGARHRHRGRSDKSVWNTFRPFLEHRDILAHLRQHCIEAPGISHEFAHAWKNGAWHCLEPLSLDVVDPRKIEDKATRWLGRATGLANSSEHFILYYLLGAPGDSELRGAFDKAVLLLHETPLEHRIVTEEEAESFAREIDEEMAQYGE